MVDRGQSERASCSRDHADQSLSKADFRAHSVLGIAPTGNREQLRVSFIRHQYDGVMETEQLIEELECGLQQVAQQFERFESFDEAAAAIPALGRRTAAKGVPRAGAWAVG